MKKIALTDLLSIEEYNAQRPAIRQSMMDHKQTRRLPLGDNASIHFEDYMVMRYQVLELIRAEKIRGTEDLEGELEAYNPLIPDGKNLKATFMLEFPDEGERRERLGQLIGIETQVSIQIDGFAAVYPIANEDLERSTEEKTSAVHFLRFEFSDEMIAAAKAGVQGLALSAAATYAPQGVRVNVVAPGLVNTPLAAPITSSEKALETSRAMHALGRIGEPDEVASAIEWLLDPGQGWVTGQVLGVDGGLSSARTR